MKDFINSPVFLPESDEVGVYEINLMVQSWEIMIDPLSYFEFLII